MWKEPDSHKSTKVRRHDLCSPPANCTPCLLAIGASMQDEAVALFRELQRQTRLAPRFESQVRGRWGSLVGGRLRGRARCLAWHVHSVSNYSWGWAGRGGGQRPAREW